MRRSFVTLAALSALSCRTPAPRPASIVENPEVKLPVAVAMRPQVPIEHVEEDKRTSVSVTIPEVPPMAPTGAITTLDAAAITALLATLPPLPDVGGAPAPLARPTTAPPAVTTPPTPIAFVTPTGQVVADRPVVPTPPVLHVDDTRPSGEVQSEESEIRISFSQSMVPVGAIDQAVAAPVTITPPVTGEWRWIDTRLLAFSADRPFPRATAFTITVRAGTKAVNGAILATDHATTFATSPVRIIGAFPNTDSVVKLVGDSPIAIRFDQGIDPARIIPFLATPVPMQPIDLATARTRWAKSASLDLKDLEERLGGNVVILAPTTPWPAGFAGKITLKPGAPSLAGPRFSTEPTTATFDVAKAFTATKLSCTRCPAGGGVTVELSNLLDHEAFQGAWVQVDGQPLAEFEPGMSSITVPAPKASGKTVAISLAPELVDRYGQRLSGTRRFTFTTVPAQPDGELWSEGRDMIIVDPRFAIPQWHVSASAVASLEIELRSVEAKDYFPYEHWRWNASDDRDARRLPGKVVVAKSYAIGAVSGGLLRVDLRPALAGKSSGHVLAIARATSLPGRPKHEPIVAWFQVTKLGLAARFDDERVRAWASSIAPDRTFLEPLATAKASLLVEGSPETAPVAANADGGAILELPPPGPPRDRDPEALLIVRAGTEEVFAQINAFEKSLRRDVASWYVTDDRFVYRPGETLYLKGWVRWTHDGIAPVLAPPPANATVAYTLQDSGGTKLASGTATFTPQGGFDAAIAIPESAMLGGAKIELSTTKNGETETTEHKIRLEEFRTPTFTVEIDDDVGFRGARPLLVGESIAMRATAKYYAGGGLPGARARWVAHLTPTEYSPPGWSSYAFGVERYRGDRSRHANAVGVLGAASSGDAVIAIASTSEHRPSVLEIEASITDVDRRTMGTRTRPILVHPAAFYVGLTRIADGELGVIATDADGAAVEGVAIEIDIAGTPSRERRATNEDLVDHHRCTVTSAKTPVRCAYPVDPTELDYVATAVAVDDRDRRATTTYRVPWWHKARAGEHDFDLVSDKPSYRPGDVAQITIHSKRLPATAIVTFDRGGVVAQHRMTLTQPATTVTAEITTRDLLGYGVVVERWVERADRAAPTAGPLPDHDARSLRLEVDLATARLAVTARPTTSTIAPGAPATFIVDVARDGKPVANAEVALIAVDEAVLSLSTRRHEDPLASFYDMYGSAGSSGLETLSDVEDAGDRQLAKPPGFERYTLDDEGPRGFGEGGGRMRSRSPAVPTVSIGNPSVGDRARKDFRATAVWSPKLVTDAQGRAAVTVTMPDALTRYRVIAIAAADTYYFGKGESTIVAALDLNARVFAPRFLVQGDVFSLPVVVQNLASEPRAIDVAVRTANLAAVGPMGKRVTVPAGQRVEVRFELATGARGRAAIQAVARSGPTRDSSEHQVQVYAPATTEAFATYGVVDATTAHERLAIPAAVWPEVGGVEVEVSATQLSSLADAYHYLEAYPHECAEQRSGRMLANTLLADMLEAFGTTSAAAKAQTGIDVAAFAKTQNDDGGWGYFGSMGSDPFVAMQVLTALVAAGDESAMQKRALRFVTSDVDARLAKLEKRKGEAPDVGLVAAGLTALHAAKVDVAPRARRFDVVARTAYSLDAKARVLAVLAGSAKDKAIRDRLLAEIATQIRERAGSATVSVTFAAADRLLLGSETRTTALVLGALIREAPAHPAIPKLVRGLLDARVHGRWHTTQENLVVLTALRRYFDAYEQTPPDLVGKLWIGTTAYAERAFQGHTTEHAQVAVGWPALGAGSTHDIAIAKSGTGRMYYRLGVTYAPRAIELPALDAGFVVRRTYRGLDDASDVTRGADGRWKIALGARVAIDLEVINTTERTGVALVDPIPAGFEIIQPRDGTSKLGWGHVNLRDQRAEAFAMHLAPGTHRLSYTVRAQVPGRFVVSPAKAEEMYAPETFGRSWGGGVTVE